MKLLIIGLILVSNISAYACSCALPNFKNLDTITAVKKHLLQNLSVNESDSLEILKIHSGDFLTSEARGLLKQVPQDTPAARLTCETDCLRAMNELALFQVNYIKENKLCNIIISAKMISNLYDSTFKSETKNVTPEKCY